MNFKKTAITGLLIFAITAVLFVGFQGIAPVSNAAAGQVRFAVISDYGDTLDSAGGANRSGEASVSALVHGWTPDLIVTAGDNNMYYGAANTIDGNIGQYYHDYIYPYIGSYGSGATTNKFFPAPGNHDWGYNSNNGLSAYRNFFTLPGNERYYDFVQGPVHFFILDADPNEPDGWSSTSAQAVWLQTRLAAASEPYKVVIGHQPPYSSGNTHGSTPAMQWPFKAWGASMVISGHDHDYERLSVGGLPYFVVGTGGDEVRGFGSIVSGSQVRWNGNNGAMLVTADSNSMVVNFYSVTGSLIDTYTINASGTNSTPVPTPIPTTTNILGISSGDNVWTDSGSVLNAMRFQNTGSSGNINKLELLYNTSTPSGKVRLGVYADNNGLPGNRLLDAGEATVVNGWVAVSGLNLPVNQNGYYWLAFNQQSANGVTFLSSASNTSRAPHYWANGTGYGPLPASFNLAGSGNNLGPYVMRATVGSQVISTPVATPVNRTFGLDRGDAVWNDGGNVLNAMRYQNTAGSGRITRLEILYNTSAPVGKVRLGIYADNNGKPGSLLLNAGEATVINGWVAVSGLNFPVTQNCYYWLAFNQQNVNGVQFLRSQPNNAHYWANGTAYGLFPITFNLNGAGSNFGPYVMRATVTSN